MDGRFERKGDRTQVVRRGNRHTGTIKEQGGIIGLRGRQLAWRREYGKHNRH